MATDFTIADVLAWARTKPADEPYRYGDSSICALAQFGEATRRHHCIGPEGTKTLRGIPDLHEALNPGVTTYRAGMPCAHTFGALVTRLEALCPKSNWLTIDAYMDDERVEA